MIYDVLDDYNFKDLFKRNPENVLLYLEENGEFILFLNTHIIDFEINDGSVYLYFENKYKNINKTNFKEYHKLQSLLRKYKIDLLLK